MNLLTCNDVDPKPLETARVAVLGYGSQGRAHARNLHDAGVDVIVGARLDGPSAQQAADDGLAVASIAAATKNADVVMLLVPDTAQPEVFEEEVRPHLATGSLLLFAHGFNVHYGTIEPPQEVDVGLVAPKSPGALVRRQFERGQGVPCLFAVHRDPTGTARARTLAYTRAIGGTRAGALETTFAEETETDLFGEQAVLCGGATELVVAGFETLTEAGYQPEVAYFECLHELKLIVDLLYEGGLAKMHEFISDTAKYGDLSRGPRIVDDHVRTRMRDVLEEIKNGSFAREWLEEHRSGRPNYDHMLDTDLRHPIEAVGRKLRNRMSWLRQQKPRAPQRAGEPA